MATLTRSLVLGTRGSALALWQTNWVRTQLRDAWPAVDYQLKLFTTSGDRLLEKSLPEIGGKGVFTQELENALRSGEIDIAVHSLKDLPIDDAPGLSLGAICERVDAHDVLIAHDGWTLASLPQGARVGTSSLRRAAQLLASRPDLTVLSLRGNVDTRIRKAMAGDYDAIVLAAAGMLRLCLGERISEYLPFEVMLPAPGQGALAVQCRADDFATRELLTTIDHTLTRATVMAERAFLDALGGGCSAPVAAYALRENGGSPIHMTGLVASLDGCRVIRIAGEGNDPHTLGAQLAEKAFTQGAGELLR